MRLDDQRESSNIEDRRGGLGGLPGLGRGQQAGGFGGRGLGGMLGAIIPLIASRFGIVGVVVVMGIVMLFGSMGDGGGSGLGQQGVGQPQQARPSSRLRSDTDRFVARVLATTEDTWTAIFAENGSSYPQPTLVLFSDRVSSACGLASSASGPFYCPGDQKIYLDTRFFDTLNYQFGASGDFASAYVIAHEVGHHVQTVTGISSRIQQQQRNARSQTEANQILMRLELQADCLAGIWAARNRNLLDESDFAEGVRAAQAIGDDTLQRQAGQAVVPDSFTHGSSEQRVRWLSRGFQSGNPDSCDTFTIPAGQL